MKNSNNQDNQQTEALCIYSRIPSKYQGLLLRSVDALMKSKWWKKAKNPECQSAIIARAQDWLAKHGGESRLVQVLQNLLDELQDRCMQQTLFTCRNIIMMTACILYVVSPADAVPDVLPVIGLVDDLGLLTLVWSAFVKSRGREDA